MMRRIFFFVMMFFVFLFVATGMMAYANGPRSPFQVGETECNLEIGGGDKMLLDQGFNVVHEEKDRGYLSSVPSENQINFLYDDMSADKAIIAEMAVKHDNSRFLRIAKRTTKVDNGYMNRTGGNYVVWVVNIGNGRV